MIADLDLQIAALRLNGPRCFARWDAELFDAVVAGHAQALRQQLLEQPDAAGVVAAYLQLVQQAIGTGAMRQAAAGASWTSFLERCLIELVPKLLPGVRPGQRLPLLVTVWNLGEGLLREPAWIDRYVTACAARLENLADLQGFLVRTLDPVLAPAPPAAWQGPFAVTVLDLRTLHEDFLPGTIVLAAPTVLRVEDRRRGGSQAGVLLRRGGRSELLGLIEGLQDHAEVWDRPVVQFQDGQATVAGQTMALPTLRCCHRHAVARGGFIAACAVDSQRLWIVESP
jgi:hypothetical protein